MPAEVRIVDARDGHAFDLAPRMRLEDAAEVRASGGYTPLGALVVSLRASTEAYTLLIDGAPAAMWGVVPDARRSTFLVPVGIAWLLTGDLVERHRVLFARLSRQVLRDLLSRWAVLHNAIDGRYEAAIRWARWLGAEVLPAVPFGRAQLPFHPFVFRRA